MAPFVWRVDVHFAMEEMDHGRKRGKIKARNTLIHDCLLLAGYCLRQNFLWVCFQFQAVNGVADVADVDGPVLPFNRHYSLSSIMLIKESSAEL
jgi:hypothetical protein